MHSKRRNEEAGLRFDELMNPKEIRTQSQLSENDVIITGLASRTFRHILHHCLYKVQASRKFASWGNPLLNNIRLAQLAHEKLPRE